MDHIRYALDPEPDNRALNGLFARAWPHHEERDFSQVLQRSLVYICAYLGDSLVGFANVAWDGGVHAFLLDPTVDPGFQGRGIGQELVRRAAEASRERGAEWLHVDYEPELDHFYKKAGFRSTSAGLMNLMQGDAA